MRTYGIFKKLSFINNISNDYINIKLIKIYYKFKLQNKK